MRFKSLYSRFMCWTLNRLKARKFQVIAHGAFGTSASISTMHPPCPSHVSLESTVQSSTELTVQAPLSTKLPPPLRAPVSDENMEKNVERIRMELRSSSLSRKLAVLSEVWALEVAAIVGASTCSELVPEAEKTSDLEGLKRVKQHDEENSN